MDNTLASHLCGPAWNASQGMWQGSGHPSKVDGSLVGGSLVSSTMFDYLVPTFAS